jgi:tetratricopeptide (TPR) repeat protein
MPYDLFISYSRRDNEQDRITQLVERLQTDFVAFAGRPLEPFFDATEIHGMDDWRHRILQGLRESRLLLACLSPAYLQSEYCEWEFNEYLKHEVGRAYFGDGVAPIYFVQVPGWEDKGFEQQCDAWVKELRRRQHFDLRPWFSAGEESLRDATVLDRMQQLNAQLKERITRGERAECSVGNMDAHNPHFIGRTTELRRLRETVALGKVGVLTALHGLGGVGKTALAIEYAHAFAHEYGGGRWQVRCEGGEDLCAAVAELAAPLALEFNEDEKQSIERRFERVLTELRRLAGSNHPHRCLLLLDNVDKPRLLEPAQSQRLPAGEWLHVIATTRLGETELHGKQKDRVFLPVDELPEADALEIIKSYQPGNAFANDTEREAARKLVNVLGHFTLAVEAAAVYLGQFADEVSCAEFLARMEKEGLCGFDRAVGQVDLGIRHGEVCLAATLQPTFKRLTKSARLTLDFTALLSADHIVPAWIRPLVAQQFPEVGSDSQAGRPDPWRQVLRQLLSLRLLQLKTLCSELAPPAVLKQHRLIGEIIRGVPAVDPFTAMQMRTVLGSALLAQAVRLSRASIPVSANWELECLYRNLRHWLEQDRPFARDAAAHGCPALRDAGYFGWAQELAEAAISRRANKALVSSHSTAWFHNMAGSCALSQSDWPRAEAHFTHAQGYLAEREATNHDRLDTQTNIACLLAETFRPEVALAPAREALALAEQMFPGETYEVALRTANLAVVMRDLGRVDEALPLMQRVLEIHQANPGQPLRHCQDLGTYAEILRESSMDGEGLIVAQNALDLAMKFGHGQHPVSIGLNTTLARVLEGCGEYAIARTRLEEAMALASTHFGETSAATATCKNNLGANSLGSGRYPEAIKEFSCALAIERTRTPPVHQLLAHRELNLGIALMAGGLYNESRNHLHEAWNHKVRTRQPDLLAARVVFSRFTLALLCRESTESYVDQLHALLCLDRLLPARVDIRWGIGGIFKVLEPKIASEHLHVWRKEFEDLKSKATTPSSIEVAVQSRLERPDFWTPWPPE